MLFLALAVLCSTGNYLLLRAFRDWKTDLLLAILANYLVCAIIGLGWAGTTPEYVASSDWCYWAPLQGLFLLLPFYFVGISTAKVGLTTTILASRTAIAIPTISAFFLFGDLLSLQKAAGLILAFVALFTVLAEKNESAPKFDPRNITYPLLVFFGSGLYQLALKSAQHYAVSPEDNEAYVGTAFIFAFHV